MPKKTEMVGTNDPGFCSARPGYIFIAATSDVTRFENAYTARHGGLPGSTSLKSIGAMPMMPMTAGSFSPFLTPS
jgi:hypothetical protein